MLWHKKEVSLRVKVLKWTKIGSLTLLGLFVIVALSSAVNHQVKTRQTEARYPMPGKLVDVGGHKLHVDIEGEGPLVIVETGAQSSSWELEKLRGQMAEFATVVTYDRAGFGWSESGPLPRTPQRVVEELRVMLRKEGLDPPYVLVGGSLGGYYMRYYASKYPEEVKGLLLIDALATDALAEDCPFPDPKVHRFLSVLSATADLGSARLILGSMVRSFPGIDAMSDEFVEKYVAMKSRSKEVRATYQEMSGLSNWLDHRKEMGHLGDMPVTVLSATIPLHEGWWMPAQEALAFISDDVSVTNVEGGHAIAYESPDVCVKAVSDLLKRVNGQKTPESLMVQAKVRPQD